MKVSRIDVYESDQVPPTPDQISYANRLTSQTRNPELSPILNPGWRTFFLCFTLKPGVE